MFYTEAQKGSQRYAGEAGVSSGKGRAVPHGRPRCIYHDNEKMDVLYAVRAPARHTTPLWRETLFCPTIGSPQFISAGLQNGLRQVHNPVWID